jgi:glycosyltransferase involved in cell wall biosynthesis
VCAAQFIEIKEHLATVRAFESVADVDPRVYLLLCGLNHRDEYYRRCETYIAASRHAGRIRLVGNVADMQGFYSAIDVFVLPSRFEAFGYVYVEAMSCERPAIACRAGGPAEIVVDGRTGYLCEISSSIDLVEKMKRYASSRELAAQHGRAARARVVAEYSKQVMVRRSEEFYLRTLGRRC